ncbi:phosphate butyryltransferase [Cohaesibacter sp. ES.047]|uniref:bifunctional enoyl-CoA hydratase/phosphate acetyltransferase n=1 Tax=Cohaesibacter sp. ES.047 TaxID=1798205 RepID=UPI000BB85EE5|nr:bifunctional enoyl-CoA hydratase/phosphate acetyltransferase [Cohaesibacter sp. ES.047]SNY92691.1 phosphate butyryltransferase [Cohaesibacter sp. ES.047]
MPNHTTFENKTYDEINIGDEAALTRVATEQDFMVFANASGNLNSLHLSRYVQNENGKREAYAPPLWVASLVSTIFGNILPGVGARYRHQTFNFGPRCVAGDVLDVKVKVTDKLPDNVIRFDTEIRRHADNEVLVSGPAEIFAPAKKLCFDALKTPELMLETHPYFEALIRKAQNEPQVVTAVVAPEEEKSLGGAILAMQSGIITPILVGSKAKIEAVAKANDWNLDGVEIINEIDHARAANIAVDLISEGRAGAMMKGHLHTDDLLKAALRKVNGLRAGRRFTHVFVMDVPGVDHPILVTDAAINIQPDLKTKADIVQNAIDVAISIGIEVPKVGILSAVETVNPDIPSSLDAALLSKMAERGQISGGVVDGPLAMDNAVDLAAARTKGITSEVAGHAEILVVPNLDAGNMLAKQLAYISHAEPAGLVLGASVPIILNSRSDGDMARLASCAIASLHHARTGKKA